MTTEIQTDVGPVKVGDTVIYRDRVVVIDQVYSDVKNGRPGFDAIALNKTIDTDPGKLVWGYADQIRAIA